MKALLAVSFVLILTGCAGPAQYLIDRDLDAAIKIADTYGRKAAADCYRAHKAHAQMKVAGIFSANEFGKTMPSFLDCAR